MVTKELKEIFEGDREVRFKLYSLEYVIKEIDNVYNGSIIDDIDRIIIWAWIN